MTQTFCYLRFVIFLFVEFCEIEFCGIEISYNSIATWIAFDPRVRVLEAHGTRLFITAVSRISTNCTSRYGKSMTRRSFTAVTLSGSIVWIFRCTEKSTERTVHSSRSDLVDKTNVFISNFNLREKKSYERMKDLCCLPEFHAFWLHRLLDLRVSWVLWDNYTRCRSEIDCRR